MKSSGFISFRTAEFLWNQAKPTDEKNFILENHGLRAFGIRESFRDGKRMLLVPLADEKGERRNFIRIFPDLSSSLMTEHPADYLYHEIGVPEGKTVIVKGYESASLIHDLTGWHVLMTYRSESLIHVAARLRAGFRNREILVAGESPSEREYETFQDHARAAAAASGAELAVPDFSGCHRGREDRNFHHLSLAKGREYVVEALKNAEKPLSHPEQSDGGSDPGGQSGKEKKSGKKSDTEDIIRFILERSEIFRDSEGNSFCEILGKSGRECYRTDSLSFSEWLQKEWWDREKLTISEYQLKSVQSFLGASGRFGENQREVSHRVGFLEEKVYIDLSDRDWRVIEIDEKGFREVSPSPVRFYRNHGDRSLPCPGSGGDPDLLWNYVNLKEENRLLLLAWLLETYRSNTDFPVLELCGEQGSGKSISQNFLRELTDPNIVNLRSMPQKTDDLLVPAIHTHIVSFENVSHLSGELQDQMCVMSTGGGFSRRTLFTNSEESLFSLKRPIIINGITHLINRPDLLDRSILLELERIRERKSRDHLGKSFLKDRSLIFSGLLELLVRVLGELPGIEIPAEKRPRMIDFGLTGEALAKIKGHPPGFFLDLFRGNRMTGIHRSIQESGPGSSVMEWLAVNPDGYRGNLKRLLDILEKYRQRGEHFPAYPAALSNSLKRLSGSLREIGIEVTFDPVRKNDGVHVQIRRTEKYEDSEESEL